MLICCSRNNTCSIYCVASYFCLFGLLFSNTTWTWKYMCPVRTRCVKEAKKSLILLLFSSIIADSVLWSGCDVRDRDICSDWLLDRQILWPAGGLGKQKRLLQNRWSSWQYLIEFSSCSVWFISLCVPVPQHLRILSSTAFWRRSQCPVSGLVCCLSHGRSFPPCLSEWCGLCVICWLSMSIRWHPGRTDVSVSGVRVWEECCGVSGAQSSGQLWLLLQSPCLPSVWSVNFLSVLF